MTTNSHAKMVGPVIRGADADLADAVIEAIEADNPGGPSRRWPAIQRHPGRPG